MKWLTGAQPLVVVLRHGLTLLVALGLMSLALRAAEQRAERREAELNAPYRRPATAFIGCSR